MNSLFDNICIVYKTRPIRLVFFTEILWTHVSGTSTIEGEEYQTDTMTYEGNGYTIGIESAYLADGNSVMDASILTSDGSEGIDVVEEGDSVYLVFGENRIDVTEQLQQYGWAVGKIALGEEIIVYELFDLRNREDIQGIARGFYQYNEFVNSVLNEQERTVLDASPIYYAE